MLGENIFISIVKRALLLFAIGVGAILLLADEPKPYIYGLLFGMVINILNFTNVINAVKILCS